MKLKALLFVSLFSICSYIYGQDIDLSSQRKESKHVNTIPGHPINHHGIIINPTPQSLKIDPSGHMNFRNGFCLKSKKGNSLFVDMLDGLKIPTSRIGVPLTILVGKKEAKKAGLTDTEGSYILEIAKKGVEIVAENDLGVFYALQTLNQLINSPAAANKTLPYLTINDFPVLPIRGVVEGFYGTPWSHDVRLSLIDYYGKNKLNTYIYGPKDDPYHRHPNWRLPYPEEEAAKIRELVEACKKNKVNFVWAAHPGVDIRWDKADYDSLLNKFNSMYDLGVRQFAIFFDDIRGDGTDSRKQAQLVNDINRDFVKKKGDVGNIMLCPTDYSRAWANPGLDGQLSIYGQMLDPDVEVFWTGDVVCSDLTPETLEFIDTRIKRPALFWWNFPVTDYVRQIILQGPVYGLDSSITPQLAVGIVSNPMEHGEASKLALYGVSDYAWNPLSYNPTDNWERGIRDIVPEAPEAYRTFAIHNGDTGRGYRRDESWETETFDIDSYSPEQYNALLTEFQSLQQIPTQLETISNRQLLKEIQPWVDELAKLGERGENALKILEMSKSAGDSTLWEAIVSNLMDAQADSLYKAHKTGTLVLQPFYDEVMNKMLEKVYFNIWGSNPSMSQAGDSISIVKAKEFIEKLELYPYSEDVLSIFDSNPKTYYIVEKPLSFRTPDNTESLIILSDTPKKEVILRQVDQYGKELTSQIITSAYTHINLHQGASQIQISGPLKIHELLPVSR